MTDILDRVIDRARPSWLVYGIAICAAVIVAAVIGVMA